MTDRLQLSRYETGVPGLDTILGGGLPELSFNIIGGAPGSGKTTFGHQIMFSLAKPGQTALFFTALGEPPVKMLRYQQQFSFFDFDKVDTCVKFISLATEVQEGNYELVLAQIRKEVETHAPAFVFIDSFRSFITGAKGESQQMHELQSFVQQLVMHMTSWQATTFLIGEYKDTELDQNPIFTVADGIIWLNQNMSGNSMVRKARVIKMRGQEQRPGLHTMRIGPDGIEIFPRTLAADEPTGGAAGRSAGRISTGVAELDTMLGGGLPAGYSMLLAGPSGSGKSVLAVQFLAEAARCKEPSIIALFEKTPSQILDDRLDKLVRSGLVHLLNLRRLDLSTDETMQALLQMVEKTGTKRVVLDSLSGFELSLAPEFREDFRESLYRMVTVLNARGITLLMTMEMEDRFTEFRFSPHGSAFLVDAIVVQRYVEMAGRLQTVISVVKVRGSAHSHDIRPFNITNSGVQIGSAPLQATAMLSGGNSATT
jgi:circadian clock protein KaiC